MKFSCTSAYPRSFANGGVRASTRIPEELSYGNDQASTMVPQGESGPRAPCAMHKGSHTASTFGVPVEALTLANGLITQ